MALHKRVQDHDMVRIQKSDGSEQTVSSDTLVPGDIILIDPSGGKVVCDSVLLSGHCIVNESSLTGTIKKNQILFLFNNLSNLTLTV